MLKKRIKNPRKKMKKKTINKKIKLNSQKTLKLKKTTRNVQKVYSQKSNELMMIIKVMKIFILLTKIARKITKIKDFTLLFNN